METSLGERELDVMAVLWERGSGTVAEVRERLPAELAYTTVLTILRNLEAKGYVRREGEGRAHRYFPRVAQRTARRGALARVIDGLFEGSAAALLAHLVSERAVSAEELRELSRRLEESGESEPAGDPPRDRARGARRGTDGGAT